MCPPQQGMCNEVITYHLDKSFYFGGKRPGWRPLSKLHVEPALSA